MKRVGYLLENLQTGYQDKYYVGKYLYTGYHVADASCWSDKRKLDEATVVAAKEASRNCTKEKERGLLCYVRTLFIEEVEV